MRIDTSYANIKKANVHKKFDFVIHPFNIKRLAVHFGKMIISQRVLPMAIAAVVRITKAFLLRKPLILH